MHVGICYFEKSKPGGISSAALSLSAGAFLNLSLRFLFLVSFLYDPFERRTSPNISTTIAFSPFTGQWVSQYPQPLHLSGSTTGTLFFFSFTAMNVTAL